MNKIIRKSDAITEKSDLEDLHSIDSFPILMTCVTHDQKEDINADLIWKISKSSGLIQLSELIPLEILYKDQHSGTTGGIWLKHHQSFSRFISKFNPESVLEIGGGHGALSLDYLKYDSIPWTIVEPNPAPVQNCPAKFIEALFDEDFIVDDNFDTVVHSHVFEHLYHPNKFMEKLSNVIKQGDYLIFSLPYMEKYLKNKQTNCINFEHTIFLTEPYIEYLLSKHGFKIIEKEYFMEEHSIFYATVRDAQVQLVELPDNLYKKNKQLYMDYIEYHSTLISELNTMIENCDYPVYLFGAHIFSQYLLKSGLNGSVIVNILDNDQKKQNKRLYGTNLTVESPEILRNVKNPVVILKAGFYNEEIKSDIINNINPKTTFL
jgi:hypothetical protein